MSLTSSHNTRRGYVVETGCPGCGGNVRLKRRFGTERCEFCDSLLRISLPNVVPAYVVRESVSNFEVRSHLDRYLKKADRPLTTFDLEVSGVYIPYWNIEGLLLKLRQERRTRIHTEQYGSAQEEKITTSEHARVALNPHITSVVALDNALHAPASLGFRTGNLVLRPLVEEYINDDFSLLAPTLGSEGAIQRAQQQVDNLNRVAALGDKRNVSKLFYEKIELIQMPYWLCRMTDGDGLHTFLVDAVTGRVESEFRGEDWLMATNGVGAEQEYGQIGVALHRCSTCGEDLPDSNALVVICGNCAAKTCVDSAISSDIVISAAGGNSGDVDMYLPFWVFSLSEKDGNKLKHGFGSLHPVQSAVIPAFEVSNAEALHRCIVRASLTLGEINSSELSGIDAAFAPATESVSTSRARMQASYLRAQLERTNHLLEDDIVQIGPLQQLLYIPFRIENYFLVDTLTGSITIEKVAVLGRTGTGAS